jgi:hypothetical protein
LGAHSVGCYYPIYFTTLGTALDVMNKNMTARILFGSEEPTTIPVLGTSADHTGSTALFRSARI